MQKKTRNILIGLAAAVPLAVGLYYVPPIHDRLAWRLAELRSRIAYFFNPPEDIVFVPTQQAQFTPSSRPSSTSTQEVSAQTPATITPTPGPQSVLLDSVAFVDQMNRWNYCGPANLTMALLYWGWTGIPGNNMLPRDQVGSVLKPGVDDPDLTFIQRSNSDVNVMPYEMVDFVNDYTSFRALYRYGGEIETLKRLAAAGFPVVTERGTFQTSPVTGKLEWVGHYAFTTGYDAAAEELIWQDSYTPDDDIPNEQEGKNRHISYADYIEGWRAFNYVFIVVYPPEQEAALLQAMGPWADPTWALQNALRIAEQETQELSDMALFFAWFNKGTSYTYLFEYGLGAEAYDYAYASIYPNLPEGPTRPYRILWYQTGPYWAYYYTSRYQDVINLADANLESILPNNPPRMLEESLYWRAMAEVALGYYDDGYADMRSAVHFNPNFSAALAKLQEWGISP
jgi:tetratricopeptide (TPR) repeat protein